MYLDNFTAAIICTAALSCTLTRVFEPKTESGHGDGH